MATMQRMYSRPIDAVRAGLMRAAEADGFDFRPQLSDDTKLVFKKDTSGWSYASRLDAELAAASPDETRLTLVTAYEFAWMPDLGRGRRAARRVLRELDAAT